MNDRHLTMEELNLLIDDAASAGDKSIIRLHLGGCSKCRALHQSLERIDSAVRRISLERVSREFTHNVLASLNIVPKTPFLFRVVENLPYVFALMIVVGLMLSVFVATGVIGPEQRQETQTTVTQISNAVAGGLSALVGNFNDVMRTYFPFLYGGEAVKLMLMAGVAVAALAMFDRLLRKRIPLRP